MESKKKTCIQKAVDLLEENGFYVFQAQEEKPDDWTALKFRNGGVIALRITPRESPGDLSYLSRC